MGPHCVTGHWTIGLKKIFAMNQLATLNQLYILNSTNRHTCKDWRLPGMIIWLQAFWNLPVFWYLIYMRGIRQTCCCGLKKYHLHRLTWHPHRMAVCGYSTKAIIHNSGDWTKILRYLIWGQSVSNSDVMNPAFFSRKTHPTNVGKEYAFRPESKPGWVHRWTPSGPFQLKPCLMIPLWF